MGLLRSTRWYHLYRRGHTITVRRGLTYSLYDHSAKGWLFMCECGETWAL